MSDRHIDPERAQFDAFKALPRDTPIHMLNLVRFKDRATYPDDHPLAGKALTGAEAYANYGKDSSAVFSRVGGSVVWSGMMEAMVIGPLWRSIGTRCSSPTIRTAALSWKWSPIRSIVRRLSTVRRRSKPPV